MATTALLIPCYNAERYLPNLKKQIEALNPKFDEVILVDDGSTDRTVESAKNIGLTIMPLGVNRGPGAARNAAAQKSRAEWIHFHDADDEIHSNYLEKVMPFAGEDNDVVLSSTEFVEEKTRSFIMRWEFDSALWTQNPLLGALRTGVNTTSSFIRKSKFEEIGGFNEKRRCWEDGDMHLRLALAGVRFRAVPDVLSTSIRHARGTSGNRLYCHRCRLGFLQEYAKFSPPIDARDLIGEVMQTAAGLYQEGDFSAVDEALNLALRLGWKGPDSGHAGIKILNYLPFPWLKKMAFLKQRERRNRQ